MYDKHVERVAIFSLGRWHEPPIVWVGQTGEQRLRQVAARISQALIDKLRAPGLETRPRRRRCLLQALLRHCPWLLRHGRVDPSRPVLAGPAPSRACATPASISRAAHAALVGSRAALPSGCPAARAGLAVRAGDHAVPAL